MQCMSTTETLGTEEPQDYDKRKWVSAHTHKALCNKFQTIIPVFSSPSGQTDNLKPLGRHQHAGLEQHHLCTSSATSSREFRAVTWNQLILNPSWPCSKQPTAKVRDLIHLWRKIRELHPRRSYESLLSQPVLIYECPNTAACTTTQTNHTAWWLPRTGKGKIPKKPGKHMTWTYLSYYTTPHTPVLIPCFYWCSPHPHSCTTHTAQASSLHREFPFGGMKNSVWSSQFCHPLPHWQISQSPSEKRYTFCDGIYNYNCPWRWYKICTS